MTRTVIVFALAVLASAGCKKSTNLGANFPAQAVVNSTVQCNSTQPTPIGIVPARHQITVQPQFDKSAVWFGGGPNVCTSPNCAYNFCYSIDGGPLDAGYFCDGGYVDAGALCYDVGAWVSYPICYNDGGYPNNVICYQDAGPNGPYFCDGGFTGSIDAGYCIANDGGPIDGGFFCDAGTGGFYNNGYASYIDAGTNFCDGGNFCDAGPIFYNDGGLANACYQDNYSAQIDAGCLDAGPGVVGEMVVYSSTVPAELSKTFTTTFGNAPALWCVKASGAEDGTPDGGWVVVSEQQ